MKIQDLIKEPFIQNLINQNFGVYIVGGCVRDLFLNKSYKDIDILITNAELEEIELVLKDFGKVNMVGSIFGILKFSPLDSIIEYDIAIPRKEMSTGDKHTDFKVEFSKDITIEEDLSRRDITVNAMALDIKNNITIDPFNGLIDLENKLIRQTNINSFVDDPLRILRCIYFSSKLGFSIEEGTYHSMVSNSYRIKSISPERIKIELDKILLTNKPSHGISLLHEAGLLEYILPELSALDIVEERSGRKHKNNFLHTIQVVDQVRELTSSLPVLWAAVFHDLGKAKTKMYHSEWGWTFHNHEEVGAKMVKPIMERLKLPTQEWSKTILTITKLHGRVKELATDESSDVQISDAAIRRLIVETEENLDDLLLFAKCDMTTKHEDRRAKYLKQYEYLEKRIAEIDEKDRLRNFKMPVTGDDIMVHYGLKPSKAVGLIREEIKNAILDGIIPNEKEAAFKFMLNIADKHINNKSKL